MKIIRQKLFISLWALLMCSFLARGQQQETPFQYPTPPESLQLLNERSSYFVEHFWDRCNIKGIFSSRKNFEKAFVDFISLMPYADSTTVFNSIDRFIKEVKKTPANMVTLGEVAEYKMYGDSAEIPYDAIYLPFAKAMTTASGLSKEKKEMYGLQVSQLENSMPGKEMPDFDMVLADGTTAKPVNFKGSYVLYVIDDPDDFDNMMARTRLSTDFALNELIENGYLKVISLYPGNPDEAWTERISRYPSNWTIAAAPSANQLLDQRVKPTFFYLNKENIILSKTLDADNLVEAFRGVRAAQKQIQAERERLKEEAIKKRENQTTE